MSIFVPNKVYLRGILLHYFIQKKSAAEEHRILVQTYGDNALSDTTCRDWFRRFKNNDFELEDKERSGATKKFQDKELEQLLDEDPSQTLPELGKILQVDESTVSKRLKGLGMIQKQGHWVPYELKPRDVERLLKMSIFVPNKVYLRGILLHYFIQKKSAAEAHRILVQTYGDNALSDTTCRDWFRRSKNNDFELEDKERSGAPKKFQDKELEQLLDEDPSQTLSELGKILQVDESTVSKRLKGLGMIQKQGHWVPYELKPRDVERRFGTCELLLQRQKRKGFLMVNLFSRNPDSTLRQGQAKLKQKGLDISYETIRTYLKASNMKWCNTTLVDHALT
ncbi:MOS1T transposase, partial [Pseudoatta argentina]